MVKRMDSTKPRMTVAEGADPVKELRKIYSEGRHYPDAKQHERSYPKSPRTPQWKDHPTSGKAYLVNEPELDNHEAVYPQGANDRQGPTYNNDVAPGWLRGCNPNARKSAISHHYPDSEKADSTHRPFYDTHPGEQGFGRNPKLRDGSDSVRLGSKNDAPRSENNASEGWVQGLDRRFPNKGGKR